MTSGLRALGVALAGRLEPTDLELAPGSLSALIGPNGAGKTSLLHAIAGIGRPAGEVLVGGDKPAGAGASARAGVLGYVPASRELAWPLSVRDFIKLTAPRAEVAAVEAVLDALALSALAERRVDGLSTGERTRVLIARALLPNPKVLLLDEPFANLDPWWRLRLADVLRDGARGGMTILFSAHDLDLAESLAGRVLILDRGRIVADGAFGTLDAPIASVFGVRRQIQGVWVATR